MSEWLCHGKSQLGMCLNPASPDCTCSQRLKSNIMVDNTGRAVLTDFSLIAFAPDQSTFLSSYIGDNTVRWMSPELLDPERFGLSKRCPTKESDCYALGMVVYEILGGCTPFATNNFLVVLRKVLNGERPERPQGEAGKLFTSGIWNVVERCWRTDPKKRASARDVLRCLEGNSPRVDGYDSRWDAVSIDSLDYTEGSLGGFSLFCPHFFANNLWYDRFVNRVERQRITGLSSQQSTSGSTPGK